MSDDVQLPVDDLADRLAEIYAEADRKLDALIKAAAARGATGTARYFENQRAAVASVMRQLEKARKPLSAALVPYAYRTGVSAVDRVLEKEKSFSGVHTSAMEVLAANLEGHLRYAEERIGRAADRAVHDAAHGQGMVRRAALEEVAVQVAAGEDPRLQARQLEDRLRREGLTAFVDKRGRRWRLSVYSRMVTRTLTREAVSVGMKNRLLDHGQDLVEISSHVGSCEICLAYQGRTFSLTGEDPTYPLLEDLPPFHPNCRHVLIPARASFERVEEALGLGPGPGSMKPAATPEAPKEAIGTGDDGIPKTKLSLRNLIYDTEGSDTWSPKFAFDMRDEPDYHEGTLYKLGQRDKDGDKYALAEALGDEISDKGYGFDPLQAQIDRHFTAKQARENDPVTVYRAVEPEFAGKPIMPGAFVTESRGYAELHGEGPLGGNYVIEEMEVLPSELTSQGSPHEFHYTPALDDAWDRIVEWRKQQKGELTAFVDTDNPFVPEQTRKLVNRGVAILDKLTGAPGDRPTIKLVDAGDLDDDTEGAYNSRSNTLQIRPPMSKADESSRVSATIHEIGHYFDYGLIPEGVSALIGDEKPNGGASDWAFKARGKSDVAQALSTVIPKADRDLADALYNSSMAKKARSLKREGKGFYTAEQLEYIDYYGSPRELWARAFAQWAAQRSGDKALLAELEKQAGEGGALPHVWPNYEFNRKIAPKIDAFLADRGLLKDEPEILEERPLDGDEEIVEGLPGVYAYHADTDRAKALQAKGWTRGQSAALSGYGSSMYLPINARLRGHPDTTGENDVGAEWAAKEISTAIDSYGTQPPKTVYRGAAWERLPDELREQFERAGSIVTDRAFTSTSADPGVALTHGTATDAPGEPVPTVLEIEVPEGTQALDMFTLLGEHSTYAMGEEEWLLDTNSRFEVTRAAEEGQDPATGRYTRTVHLRLLPPDEPTPDPVEQDKKHAGLMEKVTIQSQFPEQRRAMEEAASRIDDVLLTPPDMKPISVTKLAGGPNLGEFDREWPMISLATPADTDGDREAAIESALHETGHYFDYYGPGSAGGQYHPAHLSEEGRKVIAVIEASPSFKKLKRQPLEEHPGMTPLYREYMMGRGEQWARAFSQYIQLRSGRDVAENPQLPAAYTWAPDEFEPIAEAFDEFFEGQGVLKPKADLDVTQEIPEPNGLNIDPSIPNPTDSIYPGEPRGLNAEEKEAVELGLTPELARAGNNYTSKLSEEMNRAAREGETTETLDAAIGRGVRMEARASIPFMDRLIEEHGTDYAAETNKILEYDDHRPQTVYRGVDVSKFSEADLAALKPGAIFTEKGYLSTSAFQRGADPFGGTVSGPRTIFEIKVPEGVKALQVPEFFQGPLNLSEQEFVYPRNTRLRIDAIEETQAVRDLGKLATRRYITATLIPTEVETPADKNQTVEIPGVDVEVGITPFRGTGKAKGEDYYLTTRFKGFENAIPVEAAKAHVEVEKIERVRGVWAGGGEPSAKLRLKGSTANIQKFMDRMGSRFQQDAVISWQDDTNGPSLKHISGTLTRSDDEIEAAIAKANAGRPEDDQIQGATRTPDNRLEILDLKPSKATAATIQDLAQLLGCRFKHYQGHGELRFRGDDYE